MIGLAFINDRDMWGTYGARLSKGTYEALLTPTSLKPFIENSSRLLHGTEVWVEQNPRMQERDVSFVITITGKSEKDYLEKYHNLIQVFQQGWVELRVPKLHTEYRLLYDSCTKFGNYGLKLGKFSLRFREPDPSWRVYFPLVDGVSGGALTLTKVVATKQAGGTNVTVDAQRSGSPTHYRIAESAEKLALSRWLEWPKKEVTNAGVEEYVFDYTAKLPFKLSASNVGTLYVQLRNESTKTDSKTGTITS